MRIMSSVKSPAGLLVNYHQEPLGEIWHVAACAQLCPQFTLWCCWHPIERLGTPDQSLRQLMQQSKAKVIAADGPHHQHNRWPTAFEWWYGGQSRAIFFRAGTDPSLILANVSLRWPGLGDLLLGEWIKYCDWVKAHAPLGSKRETQQRVEEFLSEVTALVVKGATLEEYYQRLLTVILADLQPFIGVLPVQLGTTLSLVNSPAWQEATRELLTPFVQSEEVRRGYNELAAATPFGIRQLENEGQLPAYVLELKKGILRRIPAEASDLYNPTAILSAKSLLFQLLARLVEFESTVVCGISPYASSVKGLAKILNRQINPLVSVRFRDWQRQPSLADWFWGRTEEVLDAAYIELVP